MTALVGEQMRACCEKCWRETFPQKLRLTSSAYGERFPSELCAFCSCPTYGRIVIMYNEMIGADAPVSADPIDPAHYKGRNGLEAIDVIRGFDLGFVLGNAVKYILRAGKKGDAVEDLKKARWYIESEIAQLTATAAATERSQHHE